ncbi:MAG: tRNA (adenosine(37)-N6)-threonylcarbamoyltransferase complex ATPase subunit type 1 TsaE [Candidatus Omnitrophica bacterium]|nr:tRNA (adenosine(37)-N6)-threonylcarbamoyltransferase complex ATPase subunit type 1 TsaE [Candidatus Omnitrophota bacterium]
MPMKGQDLKVSLISNSAQETMRVAKEFGLQLKPGDIVFLQGDLASGKTTFVKGLAQGFRVNPKKVNSPTFVLMNYYKGKVPLYHFDFYRLDPGTIEAFDFDEYFYGDGICLIEWPERLGIHAPRLSYLVQFQHKGENKRRLCISCLLKHRVKSSR